MLFVIQLQCQYESNLTSNDCGEIGVVEVMIKLVDLGPYNRTDQQTWGKQKSHIMK